MPRVSVVIPTFNRRAFIGPTVESVLAQTMRDLEVVVVDDGSTDGTAEFLEAQFGEAIRVIRLPCNHGRSTARNTGWALARGEFVAFLDSDDIWLPGKLAAQLPHFDDPAVALVHCRVGKIDRNGAPLEADSAELDAAFEDAAARGYGYGGITETWCRMYTSAVVLRRDLLRRTAGFDPRFSNFEDWDLLWRVARDGEVATVREALVMHRTHPGNTPTIWADNAAPWLAINRKHLTELEDVPVGPETRRARGNLLVNMALGEYWRRNLPASRAWMRRALRANPGPLLARPTHYVWCAPLVHALLPRPLADRVLARIRPDLYLDNAPEPPHEPARLAA
jgi:glycosyltransferase involved in cell wall biosynthesis